MSPSNFKNKLNFGLNLFQELALDFTLLGNGKHLPSTILILYRRYLVPRLPDFIPGFSLWFVACPKRKKVHSVQYKASSYICWFGRKIAITNIRQQFYFNFNLFTKTGLSCKNHFRVWQTSKRPRKCYSSYLYEVLSPHNSSLGLVMVLTLSTAFSMDLTTEN